MAQMGMVMNLDKCIGCHTCSVTCKQAWTNRAGIEYVWFNNVETRPGQGYPRRYEDQEKWRGGWELQQARPAASSGPAAGSSKLLRIFASPVQPELSDYYEPWTYDYQNLIERPARRRLPGRPAQVADHRRGHQGHLVGELGRQPRRRAAEPATPRPDRREAARASPRTRSSSSSSRRFMFYLPRICEHCLNPSCMASCPSGAIYKRSEDGIVLVDQDRCRGWRQCITGCPYKKIYFNHKSGKAEKCTFCYPRVEVGPADRVLGDVRRPAALPRPRSCTTPDAVTAAASVADDKDLYEAQLGPAARPQRPGGDRRRPRRAESPRTGWTRRNGRRSTRWPRHYQVALPLHPEYRTMPMVWYVPPLSPVVDLLSEQGHDAEDSGQPVRRDRRAAHPGRATSPSCSPPATPTSSPGCCSKLAAMRSYMRGVTLGTAKPDADLAAAVGMTPEAMYEMYRLLAIAKYDDRYVIPKAHASRLTTWRRWAARWTSRGAGHVRFGTVRRGQRATGAGGGRDLPPHSGSVSRPRRPPPPNSWPTAPTCSTGTGTRTRSEPAQGRLVKPGLDLR